MATPIWSPTSDAESIAKALRGRRSGRGWVARCPAHDDRTPSLSIAEGCDGRPLLHCFAGCPPEAVCRALGLELRDLFFNQDPDPAALRQARRRRAAEQIEDERQKRTGHAIANATRDAEKFIASAHGVDITNWSPQELDTMIDLAADAYGLLETENDAEAR